MTQPCQLDHKGGRRPIAEYVLRYRGTEARWLLCARHARAYQGDREFVVVRLAEAVG